ncbi:hypothetical protein QTH47_12755 [Clostridium perfringens]|nr:hypothetical protein [Clostridium perfringens]
MKIEDLKVGTKLQVIKNYKGNGIMLRQGEVIKIKKVLEGETYSVSTPYYYSPIVVPKEALLECCVRIGFIKCNNKNDIYTYVDLINARDEAYDKIFEKTKEGKVKYKVEISITFDGKKYTIGDFVRVKVDGDNYYGKIKEINTTTIQLAKLSSKGKYTIELDGIAEMENIG